MKSCENLLIQLRKTVIILGIPFLSLFLFSVSICNANPTHNRQVRSASAGEYKVFVLINMEDIIS